MVGLGAPTRKYLTCSHIRKQRSQGGPDDLCGAQDKKEQGHLCEFTSCLVETLSGLLEWESAGATSVSLFETVSPVPTENRTTAFRAREMFSKEPLAP